MDRDPENSPTPAELMAFVISLQSAQRSPRRLLTWRVADALRTIIEALVSTTASDLELTELAEQFEELGERLASLPHGRRYEGASEASTTGVTGGTGTPSESTDHSDFSPIMGRANPLAPPLELEIGSDEDGEVLIGSVRCGSAYEGPPGHLHGGVTAALFDELLGATQILSGKPGMTGTLSIRYQAPVPLHTDLRFEGRLVGVDGRKISVEGTVSADGVLCATATGLFISVDFTKLAKMVTERDQLAKPATQQS